MGNVTTLLCSLRHALESGAGDISSMTFKELDFEGNLVRLTQHKTGIPIELPMVPDVKDALKEIFTGRTFRL